MPENWSLISDERRDLAALSPKRAKAAPLTFRLNLPKLKTDPRFLLPHIQNTASLFVVNFLTIDELVRALPDFPESMPDLRSLTLKKFGQTDQGKALAFMACIITEGFMAELAQFASDRKNATSAPLHRVVIVNSSNEQLPTIVLIERLRKHVAVVEVMEGRKLPENVLNLERIWQFGG